MTDKARGRTTRLVAGLGNPGPQYDRTRHNLGFMVLDRLAGDLDLRLKPYGRLAHFAEWSRGSVQGFLLKPMKYMNRSGRAVGDLAVRFAIEAGDILVVCDDFNLPLGKLRFRMRGSAGGHNGLASIIRTLGTEEFPRLRCGIGIRRDNDAREPTSAEAAPVFDDSDFVLAPFFSEEEKQVAGVIERAAEAVRLWLETGDLELCMNRYN